MLLIVVPPEVKIQFINRDSGEEIDPSALYPCDNPNIEMYCRISAMPYPNPDGLVGTIMFSDIVEGGVTKNCGPAHHPSE